MIYLIAVKLEESEIWGFPRKKQRDSFIKTLNKKFPNLKYSTSEIQKPVKENEKTKHKKDN